ncbi:MAG: hypothetical protein ABI383_14160 [Acidobacteriaceae bacterium]
MNAFCYQKQGWMHDPHVRTSDGVHPFVKIYYSPSLWRWLTLGRREGAPPDGAMLVKEQYPKLSKPLDEWTIMVKDAGGSYDGWYWADLNSPSPAKISSESASRAIDEGANDHDGDSGLSKKCPEAVYPSVGFAPYCLNCHASAANSHSTYATTSHVLGGGIGEPPPPPSPPDDNLHHRLARDLFRKDVFGPRICMIPESFDHVVQKPKSAAPVHFVTSDQCAGCHDATGTLSPTTADLPRMLWPNALASQMVNLSPNGEWRFSMMGLAGRDPIFFSQLSSENTLHPRLEDHPLDAKPFVQDLCLTCHGVMGERKFKSDTGKFFTRAELLNPKSMYGALARDGVSCAACHHISATGLGTPETYTAKFKLGPADEVYGPYHEAVATLPMKNALGIEPKATEENQIESSKLCGSCHTIVLPVYRSDGRRATRDGKPADFYEQTTYLEWLNSSFTDQSCQNCHMQRDYKGNQLSYKIANIEDNTFPKVEFRSSDKNITLVKRDEYHRHTLLGINIFALEMFRQFRTELGLYETDPLLRSPDATAPGVDTAIATSQESASQKTAEVHIATFQRRHDKLLADVQVVNLVGHSFPSGVGFRRAFIDFQVLDDEGKVLWESGGTDRDGVIVDGDGNELETEFFSPGQQEIQRHHWLKDPIRRQNQVQIYEELVVNPEGLLTTSFISLDRKVKDNRLQPKGWSSSGPSAEETGPVGTCLDLRDRDICDPNYQDGSGSSTVRYELPLDARTSRAASVRATLYYQSIPPYYLRQRATDGAGIDTDRLIRFTHKLKLENTPVRNWKLPIAIAEKSLQ